MSSSAAEQPLVPPAVEQEPAVWGDLLSDVLEKFMKNFSADKVRKSVRLLREKHPSQSNEALAHLLVHRAAVKCSLAVSGSCALPVVGFPATLITDFSYVIDRECYMVASIAYVYGHGLTTQDAVKDVLYCLGMSSGACASQKVLSNVIGQGLKGEALRAFLQRLGIVLSQKALASMVPLVGPVVGGACSYTAVRSLGRIAIEMYSRRTPTVEHVPFERTTTA